MQDELFPFPSAPYQLDARPDPMELLKARHKKTITLTCLACGGRGRLRSIDYHTGDILSEACCAQCGGRGAWEAEPAS